MTSEFDQIAFEIAAAKEPEVALLSREISLAPLQRVGSRIRVVQDAFNRNEFGEAFSVLKAFLAEYGWSPLQQCEPDRKAVRFWRKMRNLTQTDVGKAIGVSQPAMSQLEARHGYLSFANLLLAAEYLDVTPDKFIIAATTGSGPAEVVRIDQARRSRDNSS